MKTRDILIGIAFIIAITYLLVSLSTTKTVEITCYGNGVYYFNYSDTEKFAKALSTFKGQHLELEVSTVNPSYNKNTITSVLEGYVVCFKNKQKE